MINPETGWGFRDDTFNALHELAVYRHPSWFQLGDRDLATHIHRTEMLRLGVTLSGVTESIRVALGVQAKILPMTDQPVPTMIATDDRQLHFQEYLVRDRAEPVIGAFLSRESRKPRRRQELSNPWRRRRTSSFVRVIP